MILVALSPVVSGDAEALFPDSDWALFPLANPGIVSIPAGFLFGWLRATTAGRTRSRTRGTTSWRSGR